MAATASQEKAADRTISAWSGFRTRPLAERDRRSRFHSAELRAVRRKRILSRSSHGPHAQDLEQAQRAVCRGAKEGRARRLPDSQLDYRPRPRLHRSRARDHRRSADRCAAQARDHAERRVSVGGGRAQDVRVRARSAGRRSLHEVSQDAQRRRLRRLHGGSSPMPQLARADRATRRIRPGADHRRLPSRPPLRSDPAHRAQAAGEARSRWITVDRGHHSRSGGAGRTDPCAAGTQADGRKTTGSTSPFRRARRRKRCSGCTSGISRA